MGVRGGGLVVLVGSDGNVVLGCDSRCGHRVLLDSVPGLTPPPSKKGKKSWSKMTENGLKWILKACFLRILSHS